MRRKLNQPMVALVREQSLSIFGAGVLVKRGLVSWCGKWKPLIKRGRSDGQATLGKEEPPQAIHGA
jgi:hypothetical protein